MLALGYRMNHPPGSVAYQFDSTSGDAYTYEFATTKTVANGQSPPRPSCASADGIPSPSWTPPASRCRSRSAIPDKDEKGNFLTHPDGASVVGAHNWGWVFVQATVAILILVGFESVTAMGGEAKNAKRDVPIAVIASLLVQGVFCYLFEYFAANYFLNSGYTMQSAIGLGGAHRRHDDRRGQRHVRPGRRADLHAGARPSRCSWRSSAPRSPA